MQRYSLYPHLSDRMDLCSPETEYNVCLTNGKLSFENPNYHLDPARLEQGLNSSSGEERRMYQEWFLKELEEACSLTNKSNSRRKPESRLSYASLDITDMGVDIDGGPVISSDLKKNADRKLENASTIGNISEDTKLCRSKSSSINTNNKLVRRSLDLTSSTNSSVVNWSSDKPDLIENTTSNFDNEKENTYEKSESSTFSKNKSPLNLNTTSHIEEYINENIYATTFDSQSKSVRSSHSTDKLNSSPTFPKTSTILCNDPPKENLPAGWEKHEDGDGPYYWHIRNGTIQRDPPEILNEEMNKSMEPFDEAVCNFQNLEKVSSQFVLRNKSIQLTDQENRKKEMFLKRRSYPANFESEYKEKCVRFAVRSLGWVQISEDDLTPERSSKAVNKCIVDLSLGLGNVMDPVGRWGDGKDLFMDLDEGSLKLTDPENLVILNTQPIHTIRVWGVGRDNGRERDFAYVARDRISRKHMCHVFRCDIPARTIANTLRDICKKIMIERSSQQNLVKTFDINESCHRNTSSIRPTSLPIDFKRNQHRNCYSVLASSFPTPMEEPKKIIEVLYLGSIQVLQASGMNILNDAIDNLVASKQRSEWKPVNVAVAPSTITISAIDDDKVITECRVRYLSFLGIGKDVKQCAFIMHTAQDIFVCHAFHCEPSSGSLCKTIEAACKLRYQKCLDAHPSGFIKSQSSDNVTPSKSISSTLKSFVGSLTGRKANTSNS